jgi:hypothetical protein
MSRNCQQEGWLFWLLGLRDFGVSPRFGRDFLPSWMLRGLVCNLLPTCQEFISFPSSVGDFCLTLEFGTKEPLQNVGTSVVRGATFHTKASAFEFVHFVRQRGYLCFMCKYLVSFTFMHGDLELQCK